jgi:hypothetical protein
MLINIIEGDTIAFKNKKSERIWRSSNP